MSEYGKKKNDELAALCKERNLPHTGKKADLVKRLEEHDAKQAAGGVAAANTTGNEDEIDWDDEPTAATTQPAANAIAAGGRGQIDNPQAVPNQEAAVNPATTNDLVVDPPAGEPATAEEQKVAKDFSSGMADRTVDEEIEKLRQRCIRFGMDPNDNEQIKKLERAKKFGTAALAVNSALNVEEKGRKRERDGAETGSDGLRKRSRGPRGRARPTAGSQQANSDKSKGSDGGAFPKWMTEKDREAAERRKAKFATA